MNETAGAGRGLRVLVLLALGLGVWIMLRLPLLQREMGATPAAMVAPAPPLQLVSAGGAGDTVAVAQARVALAQAELAVAQARLQLLRAQNGEAFAAPAPAPMYAASPVVVTMPPPQRIYVTRAPAERADHDWVLPLPTGRVRKVAAGEQAASPLPVETVAADTPQARDPGHAMAAQAYARLQAGDKRGAAALFDAALATAPVRKDDPDRAMWAAERRRLGKRWAGELYSLFRDGGAVGPTASPVLGGGQTGINASWTWDPLAKRPVALVARFNTATGSGGAADSRTGQAAFGVRWQPVKGMSVTAERLVRVGEFARNDWNLRLAGGADGRRGKLEWNAYGEAGVLGSGDLYGGAQARAGARLFRWKQADFVAGGGAWGSVQTARYLDQRYALGRFDMGPTVVMRAPVGRTSVELSADYRFRLAGGALPASGPALTLSTGF